MGQVRAKPRLKNTTGIRYAGRLNVFTLESSEIQQAFAIELSEMLADMESALLGLEAHPASVEELNRLFRAVHTIKGSAAIVSVAPIETFCHAIENILVHVREHRHPLSSSLISLFIDCHDHIWNLTKLIQAAGYDPNVFLPQRHFTLIQQLDAWHPDSGRTDSSPCFDQAAIAPEPAETSNEHPPDDEFSDDIPPEKSYAGDAVNTDMPPSDRTPDGERDTNRQRTVRVETLKLDQLSSLIVELVTASSVLETQARRLGDMAVVESSVHVSDLIRQLQEKSMAFQMVPVKNLFQRFQRMIYDIGKSTGKNIRLDISGENTELDRGVAEKLYEPLLHLVRNAADHGIESAAERERLGKHPDGTIHLTAAQDAGCIIIRVEDDGQGIDLDAVAHKAIEKELASPEVLSRTRDVIHFIFEPGFSTLEESTLLSGRGVGLDAVKKTIESIRGRISVETAAGTGTTFRITIPLSLSMMNGLMVELGEGFYILPIDSVIETLEMPDGSTLSNGCMQLREHVLPCIGLREVLAIESDPPSRPYVVVVRYEDARIGLVVDRIIGETRTVIKPLGKLYQHVTTISGVSILGDGSIALFLEIDKLLHKLELSR
jgi:two-component system chemotaxis sensor kinase CheA